MNLKLEFLPENLRQYLRRALPDLVGEMQLERIGGGQSNPTFFVSFDNRRLVLRKQPPGELLASAHAVDREYRVLKALAGSNVPVPAVLLFCDDHSVIGTSFYIMERLEGRVFPTVVLEGMATDQRRAGHTHRGRISDALPPVQRPPGAVEPFPHGFHLLPLRGHPRRHRRTGAQRQCQRGQRGPGRRARRRLRAPRRGLR